MYFAIIGIISLFVFLEMFNKDIIEKYKYVFAFTCFALLVFQDGFRWETGTDWDPYHNFFEELTISEQPEDSEFDIGYVCFTYVIRTLTDNYTVFLTIYAILFYGSFFYLIFKASKYPFTSLLVFYMCTVYYLGMNRQFMAMMLYAIGLVKMIENKKGIYIFMILLGAFFHKTILIGLIALFINKKLNTIWVIGILAITMLIAASGIINRLPIGLFALLGNQAGDKMEYYSINGDATSMASMLLATIRRLIWIVPLMVFEKRVEDKPQGYHLFFNLYLIGTVFYILCNGTILQIIVSRALIYFNIMEMFLVPVAFTLLRPNYGKLIATFLLVAYTIFFTFKGFAGYGEGTDYFLPYKGIFINTDYNRQYTR